MKNPSSINEIQPSPGLENGFDHLTPREIVTELDKYIVGQHKAKKSLALALRDRLRRQLLTPEFAGEIQPRNILLIGSTGVGKTELAKRLARFSRSPFLKVEASKFTEVGYVGRDVESIIRDLVEVAAEMVRREKAHLFEKEAEENAEERLLEILSPKKRVRRKNPSGKTENKTRSTESSPEAKETLRKKLREGKLNDRIIELEVQERFLPSLEIMSFPAEEESDPQFRDFLAGVLGARTFKKKMKVREAIDYLMAEEESKLIDPEQVAREAVERVEQTGIVFIDELDKIAGRETGHGPDVSREGVQRDILPIIEGTSVSTRYGIVQSDFVLFIAAGAFHVNKPSDLIPELQGRFPVRVEMDRLAEGDFIKILKQPRNALIKQYSALLQTEGVDMSFTSGAVREIAHFAWLANEALEDIGARRLQTVMEALVEEISFQGSELAGKKIKITVRYVRKQLAKIAQDTDLSRYIL
jgi:ATP-dependent HslUV protease ATP-binding subunit HslU